MTKRLTGFIFMFATAAVLMAGGRSEKSMTIVDVAAKDGRFKTLLAALKAAELDKTLMGAGPFTVFAPTDEAFAKLPTGTVDALLKDIPTLKKILTYHVVSGRVYSSDVVNLSSALTIQGSPIAIEVAMGSVKLNGSSNVTAVDILTTNGVIHVIDSVLLPK